MKSRFHEAADAELTEAVTYYDAKASGLGDRFLTDVKDATRYIECYPELAPATEDGVRAKVLLRFRTASCTWSSPESCSLSRSHIKAGGRHTGANG